ncbi:hypothetical protein ALC56_01409, partial [Trachymyrmex septentrionalis]
PCSFKNEVIFIKNYEHFEMMNNKDRMILGGTQCVFPNTAQVEISHTNCMMYGNSA